MPSKFAVGQLWDKARNNIPQLILYTFAAGIFVVAVAMSREDPESQKRLTQLRQMAAETPLLPGFQKRRTSENSKRGRAMLTLTYTSPAKYEEVRDFYSKELVAKGWGPPVEKSHSFVFGPETKSITFQSGEFLITIGEGESSEFTFIYRWEKK